MANTLLTISMITRESLRVLENNLTFAKHVSRQYDSKFGVEGAKIGTTLNIRKPPRYIGRTGQAINIENATETQTTLALDTQFGVDIQFSSQDLALSIDDFSDRFLKPAIAVIANKIDFDGLNLYKKVAQQVGTNNTVPTAFLTYLQARLKLANSATPMDDSLAMILNPEMEVTIVDALKGLFQQSSEIANQYLNGTMGRMGGFKWSMDQNVRVHTVATHAGTPLTDGANQSGASLLTNGWSSGAVDLKEGDVFTIDNVNGVNPQNREDTGSLMQFVVTADISDTAGVITIPLSPAIVGPGSPFQNVAALPGNDDAINIAGSTGVTAPQGLAFHKDAFVCGCADLPLPGGVDMAARISDPQLGFSIRLVRQYNISTDQFPCRLDILYGWKELYPELACRIAS